MFTFARYQKIDMQVDDFIISDDPSKLQTDVIHQELRHSYWAKDIPAELVKRSIENSICFGVYLGEKQVGFARVVSDQATFAYIADVFIREEFQGRGLSKRLMEYIMNYPSLQGLRRWMLATRDAHGLYARYGFKPLTIPDRWMEKHVEEVYQTGKK